MKNKILLRLLKTTFLALFFSAFISSASAFAATCYWKGAASPNNGWSVASNWVSTSGGSVACGATSPAGYPGGGDDTAVFDNTSDVSPDTSGGVSLAALTMSLGYDGTIDFGTDSLTTTGSVTLNSGTLTVSSGTITIGGDLNINNGTFTGGSGTIDINSTSTAALNLDAGTFTASSGTTYISGGWDWDGGTFNHNNGTVEFDGNVNGSIDVPTSVTGNFYSIVVNKGAANYYVGNLAGDTLNINETLTLNNGKFGVYDGTYVYAKKNLIWNSTFDGGSAASAHDGMLRIQTISDVTIPDMVVAVGGDPIIIPGLSIDNLNKSDLSVAYNGTDNFRVQGAFEIINNSSTGGTFDNASDVDLIFDDVVDIRHGTFNSGSNVDITFTGNFKQWLGTVNLENTTNPTFTGTYELANGSFYAGAGTITANAAFTISNGTFYGQTCSLNTSTGDNLVVSGGTFDMETANLDVKRTGTQTNGFTLTGTSTVFEAPGSGKTFKISGALNYSSGTFNHNNGKVEVYGASAAGFYLPVGGLTLYDFEINKNDGIAFNLDTGDDITLVNSLILTNGKNNNADGEELILSSGATLTYNSGYDGASDNGAIILNTAQTITLPDGAQNVPKLTYNNSGITIKTGGSADVSFFGTHHVTQGVFNNEGDANITFLGAVSVSGGTFYAANTGTPTLTFDNTLTVSSGTFYADTATIYTATGYDVVISGGTFDAETANLDIRRTATQTSGLEISGTAVFEAPGSGKMFRLSGALRYSGGTFNHNNGKLEVYGTSSTQMYLPLTGLTLYDYEINKNDTNYVGHDDGDDITVLHELRLRNGKNANGGGEDIILESGSSLVWDSTYDGAAGFGFIVLNNAQTITIPVGQTNIPSFYINNASTTVKTGGSSAITYYGYLTVKSGTFNNEANANISYSNPIIIDGGTYLAGSGATMTTDNDMTISSGEFTISSGTLDLAGTASDLIVSGGTFNGGSATIWVRKSSATDGIEMTSGVFNATSGTINIRASITITGGTFNHNNGVISFYETGSESSHTIRNNTTSPWGSMTFDGTDISSDFNLYTTQSSIKFDGNVTVNTGTLDGNSLTLYMQGADSIWQMGDSASAGYTYGSSGTVYFTGSNNQIKGNTTFRNLRKPSNSTLTFEAGSTTTILGTWEAKGTSVSDRLILKSSSPGTQWNIDPQGTRDLEYLDVQDSNNINATAISAGTGSIPHESSPNNTNWLFPVAPTVSNLGPVGLVNGSATGDTTPTLTFSIDDTNNENVNYQIQIDDSSGFGSPVVDYTSGYAAEGSKSFTVGQAAGTGTYAVGSEGQTLGGASYYWRVRSTNQTSGITSSWSTANAGSVAFMVDLLAPNPVMQTYPVNTILISDTTPVFTWSDLSDEASYTIQVSSASDFSTIELEMTNIPQNSTSKEATTVFGTGVHYWRIWGVDEVGNYEIPSGYEDFEILNLIPEFSDYVYLAVIMLGFGMIYLKREEIVNLAKKTENIRS